MVAIERIDGHLHYLLRRELAENRSDWTTSFLIVLCFIYTNRTQHLTNRKLIPIKFDAIITLMIVTMITRRWTLIPIPNAPEWGPWRANHGWIDPWSERRQLTSSLLYSRTMVVSEIIVKISLIFVTPHLSDFCQKIRTLGDRGRMTLIFLEFSSFFSSHFTQE